MTCCSSYQGAATAHFSEKIAQRDLADYRQKGPGITARLLRDGLLETGPLTGLLLDIGSGVGALTFALLDRGMTRAVAVDASPAYVRTAVEEAARRRRTDVTEFVQADFLSDAPRLPIAAIVTLDRAICCYPAWEPLLEEALRHAERRFAMSYPRDRWYVRLSIALDNGLRRLRGNPFRTFVHSAGAMERVIRHADFELQSRSHTWTWSADVYVKSSHFP